ncbi:MAG TPA: hypothetical protein VGS08_04075 [Candidatus Saccharimonadales bacterium]|nr:hypothetical protein [Candidatus Saccharimonadales bacterium]
MHRPEALIQLDRSLGRIDWDPGNNQAVAEAAEILAAAGPVRLMNIAEAGMLWASEEQESRRAIADHATPWSFFQPGDRSDVVLDTPTHTKYLVGGTLSPNDGYLWHDNPYGYKIWVHAWRQHPTRQYADVEHNHRYALAAAPVGEVPYWMRLWQCDEPSLRPAEVWIPSMSKWQQPDMDRAVRPGEAWYMSSLDIHSISQIGRAATSIMVQGPRQRTKSYIFDPRKGVIIGDFPDGHGPVELIYASPSHGQEPYLDIDGTASYKHGPENGQAAPRLSSVIKWIDASLVRAGIVAKH